MLFDEVTYRFSVMSLEAVKSSEGRHSVLLDRKDGVSVYPVLIKSLGNKWLACYDGSGSVISVSENEYGKTWCCWELKRTYAISDNFANPKDVKREEAPWRHE